MMVPQSPSLIVGLVPRRLATQSYLNYPVLLLFDVFSDSVLRKSV